MENKLFTNEEEIIALYDKVDLVIDHSREETFNRCQQEALYSYELSLTPLNQDSDALDFGSRLHKYLETYDEKAWEGYKEIGKHKRDHRTRQKGIAISQLYKEKYGSSDHDRFNIISQETKFGFIQQKDGQKILIKGSIDQVLQSKEDDTLWVNEFKHSAAYNDITYFQPYYLGNQVRYYLEGVRRLYPKATIGGVIINLFQVTKEVTDEADLVRKEIAIEDMNIAPLLGVDTASEWLRARADKYWKRNTGACRRYNKICPFFQVCKYGMNDLAVMASYKEKGKNEWHL